ncbi:MAG: HEAT repeat domain-containing protein [Cyanobacteria bacterium Co-bin8]|nr:HEAT repeat domain-containing protein [Cyanobacteria bacterium Co-bin8]
MASPSAELAVLIKAVETADSKAGIVQAVRALSAANHPEAVPTLIEVLGYNNPGAAVAATEGLVSLGAVAVPALLEQLDGHNYGARAWAIRALALIQDPRALNVLVETARGDFALSVRRAAAKGLGTLNWSKLPEAAVEAAQAEALTTLIETLADPEWVVRYAAVVGLQALALASASATDRIGAALETAVEQDLVLAVQARAQMALDNLNENCSTGTEAQE